MYICKRWPILLFAYFVYFVYVDPDVDDYCIYYYIVSIAKLLKSTFLNTTLLSLDNGKFAYGCPLYTAVLFIIFSLYGN